ncbi:MAG: hypothetical protein H2057_04610 [Alphaproteobacteria bacterium]|nr:hypothetical protein [Alphaproteobacteria bacterium]
MRYLQLSSLVSLLSLSAALTPVVKSSFFWEESSASSSSYTARPGDVFIGHAMNCEDLGDFKMAAHFWGEYFDASSTPDPHYYSSYARALKMAGEYEQCSKIWKKYFKKATDPRIGYCEEAAIACIGMGDYESASKHWDLYTDIARKTNMPLNVELLPGMGISYSQVGRFEDASRYWYDFFGTEYAEHNAEYAAGAISSYISAKRYEDAKALYERFKEVGVLPAAAHFNAAGVYAMLGDYSQACDAWDKYFSLAKQIVPNACRLAALSFICNEKYDRALAMYKKIPALQKTDFDKEREALLSRMLKQEKLNKDKRRTKHQQFDRGQTPKSRRTPSTETIHAIQIDVVKNIVAQARNIRSKIVEVDDSVLRDLHEKIERHYMACLVLEQDIKSQPYVAALSSGSASSSSSSSSSEDVSLRGEALNPIARAQHLLQDIKSLHDEWSRKHSVFQKTQLAEAKKAHFRAFAENPGTIFTMPETMNVRYLFGYEKAASSVPASVVSSPSSAPSLSSSSSSVGAAPKVSWHFATKHVTKQRDELGKMPSYIKDKIDLFVSEIEADPLQQRHRSGRLKSLLGATNTFSRRVDQGNRFVYKIEETAPGHFNATILSFLGHYKRLDFSKQS